MFPGQMQRYPRIKKKKKTVVVGVLATAQCDMYWEINVGYWHESN